MTMGGWTSGPHAARAGCTMPRSTCCGSTGAPASPAAHQAQAATRAAHPLTLSRVLAVEEHGRELLEAQRLDLEGIVAKRRSDTYSPDTIWYKVKNPAYTQAEGRGDLFYKPR